MLCLHINFMDLQGGRKAGYDPSDFPYFLSTHTYNPQQAKAQVWQGNNCDRIKQDILRKLVQREDYRDWCLKSVNEQPAM